MRTSRRLRAATVLAVVAGSVVAGSATPAHAITFPDVTVRLTVLEIEDLGDDLDSTSDADFYTMIKFSDGVRTEEFNNEDTDQTDEVEGEEHIHPNWETVFTANPAQGSVSLDLTVKDEDGGLNFDDDTADVIPDGTISLKIGLRPCVLSGDLTGICGQPIATSGGDKVVFKVDVILPTSTPGLRMQCLHSPIWPKPGDTVTITATALDGAANPMAVVDFVRITFNGVEVRKTVGAPTISYAFLATGAQFDYECMTENNGGAEAATTTPRTVRIGDQSEIAVPVIYTGSSTARIDVVLLADNSYAGGYSDPAFQTAVYNALLSNGARRGLYANAYTLTKQNAFNVWIAKTAGADISGTMATCDSIQAPENWDRYSFADSGWILHSDTHRDCADGGMRLFGAEPTEPDTAIHEMGHTPFGLADEYPPDGGYWQDPVMPNLYSSLGNCQNDAPNVGVAPGACHDIGAAAGTPNGWYTSDPTPDVMADDQQTFNPLDRRRWERLTLNCTTKGAC